MYTSAVKVRGRASVRAIGGLTVSALLGVGGILKKQAELFADVLKPVHDRRNGFDLRHRPLAEAPILPDAGVDVRAVVELGKHHLDQSRKVLLRRLDHRLSLRKKPLLLVALYDVLAQLESSAQRDLLLRN